MTDTTMTCLDTYRRDPEGVWRYPWGDAVPGAHDVLLGDVVALHLPPPRAAAPSPEDVLEIAQRYGSDRPLLLTRGDGTRDVVLGMRAPELDAPALWTAADVADAAGVSKATIDSYRYRGLLPEPQLVLSRTPLWARPIVQHWLADRPGAGWRSDVYGTRERREPDRTLPISRARARSRGDGRVLEHLDGR